MSSNSVPRLTVKAELQYDYSVQAPLHWSSGIGPIDGDICDNVSLQLYFIQGTAVMTLKQSKLSSPNAAPNWIVGDMGFNDAKPIKLHTLLLPPQTEVVTVVSDAGEMWLMKRTRDDTDTPNWRNFSRPPLGDNYVMVDARPFLDADRKLWIASLITEKNPANAAREIETNIYLLDPEDTNRSWKIDQGIDSSDYVMKEFIPNSIFGSASNNSKYGFLVCGNDVAHDDQPGIAILPGGTSIKNVTKTIVTNGLYDSVSFVELPFVNTPPLIFAIDSATRKAALFSRTDDSTDTYSKLELFGGVHIRQIQASLRINCDDKPYRLEICAVTEADQILHVTSKPFDEITIRTAGKLTYSELRNFAIVADNSKSMFLASSQGFATLMVFKKDATLVKMVQDNDAIAWSSQLVNEPALKNVQKQPVYYIEVTVEDSNRVPAFGSSVSIGSLHYAEIVVNGYAVIVSPDKRYYASVGPSGKIFISMVVNSLATPTLTIRPEGMPSNKEISIQATIKIQEKFKDIQEKDLRDARRQESPKDKIFSELSDDRVKKLAQQLRDIAAVLPNTSSSFVSTENSSQKSLLVLSDIARIHDKDQRSLGHIAPQTEASFSVRLAEGLTSGSEADSKSQSLDLSWADLFLCIKENIYTLVNITVEIVEKSAHVVLDLVEKGITYVWRGIVRFVRQVLDMLDVLFASVGCKFKDLFSWLCYLLDWEDIKATALVFKGYISTFKTDCTYWIDNILPKATDEFFKQCQDDLSEKFDSAKSVIGDEKLAMYDPIKEPQDSSTAKALTAFNNLPSTATWLQSKFIDCGGESGTTEFSRSLDTFDGLFNIFRNALTDFYSDDLKSAAKKMVDLLESFVRRDIIDDTKIVALIDAVKSALNSTLKTVSSVIKALAGLAKEALQFLDEILSAKIFPSVLGDIFKDIFGFDLTLENAICFSIAIPFTILHKIVTGYSPSQTITSARSARSVSETKNQRSPTLWRGILALINTLPDITVDLMGIGADLIKLEYTKFTNFTDVTGPFKQYINGACLFISMLDYSLMDPTAMLKGTPRQKVAVSIPTAVITVSVFWFAATRLQRGPRGEPLGQIFLSLAGVCGFGSGVWYVAEKGSLDLLGVAQLLRPLSLGVKWLRVSSNTKNPKVVIAAAAAMGTVDLVSGFGSGIAWCVAGANENE